MTLKSKLGKLGVRGKYMYDNEMVFLLTSI